MYCYLSFMPDLAKKMPLLRPKSLAGATSSSEAAMVSFRKLETTGTTSSAASAKTAAMVVTKTAAMVTKTAASAKTAAKTAASAKTAAKTAASAKTAETGALSSRISLVLALIVPRRQLARSDFGNFQLLKIFFEFIHF
jgi:cell envelope opacity-associated protein A